VLEYKSFTNVPIKLTMPRVGWYNEIKKYLLDFRLVLQKYLPEYMDKSDEELKHYLIYIKIISLCSYLFIALEKML
jgi:late competence protein required for DNA uptake (superfamily II DNA/RNA helicase)